MSKKLKGYMCGTSVMDISLGANDVIIYSSVKALKKAKTCWKDCGIVEIELNPKVLVKSKF